MTPSEYVVDNYIAQEYVDTLKPFFFVENLSLTCKFKVKDNLMHPNSKIYRFASLIFCVAIITFHVYAYVLLTESLKPFTMCILFFFHYFILLFEFVVLFVFSFSQTQSMVFIFSRIQFIDSKLKLDLTKLKNHKKYNLYMCLIGYSSQLITGVVNVVLFGDVRNSIIIVSRLIFDTEIMFAIFMFHFVTLRLNVLREKIKELDSENVYLLDVFVSLLEVHKEIKKVFTVPITFSIVKLFLHSMIYVEIIVAADHFGTGALATVPEERTSEKYQNLSQKIHDSDHIQYFIAEMVLYVVWLLRILALIVMISSKSEDLDGAVRMVKQAAVGKMADCDDEQTRRLCKNILRVSSARYKKTSCFSVAEVGAGLPLRLGALVAAYTVVLLQFAFL